MYTHTLGRMIRVIAFLVATLPTTSYAAPTHVTVDTSALSGTTGSLAFDFLDGGTPANTVTLSDFTSDGTLGTSTPTGDVSGALPGTVTLGDSEFFNEYLQGFTFGGSLSFTFDTTGSPADPTSFPDAFSFFLLDSSGMPVPTTSDPTGANALLLYNVGETDPLSIYSDTVRLGGGSNAVPEPNTLILIVTSLFILSVVLIGLRRFRKPTSLNPV